MDSRDEHAFVVSLHHPVFCANNSASFTPSPFLVREDAVGRDAAVIGGDVQLASVDDDEVMGGTLINLTSDNIERSRYLSAAYDGQECHNIDRLQHGPVRHVNGAQQMSSLQHLLRTRHEVRDNQDLVIADSDEAPWAQIGADGGTSVHGVSQTPRATFSNSQVMHESAVVELRLEEHSLALTRDWHQRLAQASLPVQDIHQDALAVDHPNRFYDVSDFLDNWAVMNPRLEILQARQRRIAGLDQARNIFKDDALRTDIQGIDWLGFKVAREEALVARQQLHPQRIIRRSISQSKDQQFYKFRSFHARHRASNAHYQLRNVLAASSRANVFYATGSTVSTTSLAAPGLEQKVMDFNRPSSTAMPFRITCLASSPQSPSAVIAGGFNGEYAVLNLDTEYAVTPHEGFVSHAYDGLVTHVHSYRHRHSGGLRAAFSTNDRCIRTMDVATLGFTNVFHYNHAVNATCMSPDGRLRLLVGDHFDALITDAEQGTPLVALTAHSKEAFACAWSADGTLAATGAQDGMVALWDTRNWSRPLEKLNCLDTCARSVHFAENNRLIMAENEDVISIYDARTMTRQNVRFFGSIAGVTLLDGGREIVIANSDQSVGGLMVLEQAAVLRESGLEAYDNSLAVLQRRRNERLTEAFNDIVI
ncbi:hypothetical protein AMS68_001898 [Peltaster fructicola]|uniref:Uncharacterized protein n=1 Tax=Peltaster fructicola TaxID=286661 RepID=A0A6H0XNZ8_9PEZI|nr:hypothetical protein AMS68_001898 [Peltaster fructicola]